MTRSVAAWEDDLRFEILGPMRVIARNREITVRAGRDRAVLAMLVLHAGRTVPVTDLVDGLWADSPARDARGQLHGCISRLRKRFTSAGVGSPVISTEPEGYRLLASGAAVDLLEFRGLVTEARVAARAGRHAEARDRYRAALALWRGPALACIDRATVRQAATGLEEERARAIEECIDLELALGGAGELVGELTELVGRYPYRERLHAALMLALYRADRQADALATYQRIRRTLVAELGQEPGPALRELHQRILAADDGLRLASGDSQPSAPPSHHLPRTLNDFTGRDADLAWLMEVAGQSDQLAPVVIAIDGMPGVGKTSLAVRAAHLLKSRYPDGQLFIDLHGHSEHRPVDTAAALSTLLGQLGIPATRIAADLHERLTQWRAEVAARRLLIVLDNAATGAQVEQLLPAAAGCLTLVTSRRRLVDLDGARPRSVGTLSPADAVALLERVVGPRVRAEPQAAAEVAKRCGYLPLALRLAAARLLHRPAWHVRDLAERLSHTHTPLGELSAGDRTVAGAFALSYAHLTAESQGLFRLLGLHIGEHFDAYSAAALADIALVDAQRLLEELADGHLIEEPRAGRYRLHDLVKTFAAELAIATEPDAERHAAVERILDYYLHAAAAACSGLDPDRRWNYRLGKPKRRDLLAKHGEWGVDWLEVERPNLIAAVQCAARGDHHRYAFQLAGAMWRFLYMRGYLDDLASTQRMGLAAAEHLQDPEAAATMHNYLASAYFVNGNCHRAIEHLRHALAQHQRVGDKAGTTRVRRNLAAAYSVSGLHHQAVDESERALAAARRLTDPATLALTLINAGEIHLSFGRHRVGLAYSRRGLALAREIGHERAAATALGNIGKDRARLGELRPALRILRAALRARRRTSNRWAEAEALNELGVVHRLLGDHEQAVAHHREALVVIRETGLRQPEYAIYNELGHTLSAMGDKSAALEMHRRALAGTAQIQDKYGQARALDGIAACVRDTDPESARQHWIRALRLYRELDVPERRDTERELAALTSPPPR